MKISNSGHSVIVTAKWFGPHRPYITGGQLPGMYIFSQAHFHWGRNDKEGSEHTIEGVSQPLEVHVMYFKTDYGTPENAMKELDGIVVLAYLYNVRKKSNAELVPVIEALPKVVQPYTSSAIQLTPISKLTPTFTDDYYLYWGSVLSHTNYKIVWIVHRQAQTVSAEQLALFRMLMGADKEPLVKNFRDTKSVNGRTILFVNPGSVRDRTLIEAEPDPVEKPSTPPPENRKQAKSKNAQQRKSMSQRRKSAKQKSSDKRKSSVRRQSKKSTQKLQKSEYEDNFSHDNDQDVLRATIIQTESSGSQDSESSTEASSDGDTSATPPCGEGSSSGSSTYDIEGIENRCELVSSPEEDNSPAGDIPELLAAGSNISSRCDDLLNRLQASTVAKMDILNNLERMVAENIESKDRRANQKTVEIDSISDDSERVSPQNISMLKPFELTQVKALLIKMAKCPEMQFAVVHSVPEPNLQQITILTIGEDWEACNICPVTHKFSLVARQPLSRPPVVSSRIPLSLTDRIRRANRRRSDQSIGESSETEVDKNAVIIGELLNNKMLTAVWKQVASTTGMVVKETSAEVTSQTSNNEKVDNQKMSHLQQNTVIEIEPKSTKGRFQGQKVEKLKKKRSGALLTGSSPLDAGKRQTMVMRMFVNEVAANRKLKVPPVKPEVLTQKLKVPPVKPEVLTQKLKVPPVKPEVLTQKLKVPPFKPEVLTPTNFKSKVSNGLERGTTPNRPQSPSQKPAWKF